MNKYILYFSWFCNDESSDRVISVYDTYEEAMSAAEKFAKKPLVWDIYGAKYGEDTRFTIGVTPYNLTEIYEDNIESHLS